MASIDDSILDTPSLEHGSSGSSSAFSDPPSSDDDPHRYLGQVTPHRIVSPVVRRNVTPSPREALREAFDLGSDDSVGLEDSPTREHVARMSGRKGRDGWMTPRHYDITPLRLPMHAGSARRY